MTTAVDARAQLRETLEAIAAQSYPDRATAYTMARLAIHELDPALAAERRATVERIRERIITPALSPDSDYVVEHAYTIEQVLRFLDEEANR